MDARIISSQNHLPKVRDMIDKETLEKISARLSGLLPPLSAFPAAGTVRQDMEKQFCSVLQSILGKLNLVTREEFDAQLKVLHRAEQTIAELEEKINQLEKTTQS